MEQKNKTIWAKILQVLITVLTSIATTLTTNAAVIGSPGRDPWPARGRLFGCRGYPVTRGNLGCQQKMLLIFGDVRRKL